MEYLAQIMGIDQQLWVPVQGSIDSEAKAQAQQQAVKLFGRLGSVQTIFLDPIKNEPRSCEEALVFGAIRFPFSSVFWVCESPEAKRAAVPRVLDLLRLYKIYDRSMLLPGGRWDSEMSLTMNKERKGAACELPDWLNRTTALERHQRLGQKWHLPSGEWETEILEVTK